MNARSVTRAAWREKQGVVYNAPTSIRPTGRAAEPQGVMFFMLANPFARRLGAAFLGLALAAVAVAEVPIKPVNLAQPTETDAKIAKASVRLLETAHLTRHKVDEAMSKRVHQLFLANWDPTKRFYLQSDIDDFAKFEKEHAEYIREGRFDHAYTMFKKYRDRLEERVKWVYELAAAPHDFAKA